jgi:hypothetical protein
LLQKIKINNPNYGIFLIIISLKLKYPNVAAPVNCYFFDFIRIDPQKDLAFIENMISKNPIKIFQRFVFSVFNVPESSPFIAVSEFFWS